jgi:kynurenine formamidase
MTDDDFRGRDLLEKLITRCSNWGRWGEHDRLGALNLVGPPQVRAAAALVRNGTVHALGLPLDDSGPQRGGRRGNPRLHMIATGTDHVAGHQLSGSGASLPRQFGVGDDMMIAANQAGTHLDALAHIFWRGRMYNGVSATEVSTNGAADCDIATLQGHTVMRGVLIDPAGHLGQDRLERGYAIGPDLVEACLDAQGASVTPGDALLVRTGHLGARRDDWGDYCGGPAPGLSLEMAQWLHDHDVALVASDTWGVEVRPNEIDMFQPLHVVSLVHSGIIFGENFVLDALASACAHERRWEFQLCLAPLPITGACGSPVDPLAIL